MNSVIVIEGPDNIGKSTLIKQLAAEYPEAMIEHFGANKTLADGKRVFKNMITTLKSCDERLFIFDRSPFGEFVYAPLYRNYSPYVYWDEAMSLLNTSNTRFLFIVLIANELTYQKFKIFSKEDEKVKYQKSSEAGKISEQFRTLAHNLHNDYKWLTKKIINSNEYDTLDDRNDYIRKLVRHYWMYRNTVAIISKMETK